MFLFKRAWLCVLMISTLAKAKMTDTLVVAKETKHYFRPSFYFDLYATSARNLDLNLNRVQNTNLARRVAFLQSRRTMDNEIYRFRLLNIGFSIPIYTKTYTSHDYKRPTLSILALSNILSAYPQFDFLYDKDFGYRSHRLHKISIGLRMIYTSGNKNTWFVNFSPFVSQDQYTFQNPTLRWWGGFVFSRTVSPTFSYRMGLIKTFLLAEQSYLLPYVGVRIGSLNKVHLQVFIPRNLSLNVPLLEGRLYFSVYSRPIGGVFNYNNEDNSIKELAPTPQNMLDMAQIGTEIQFRFQELLFGLQVEYKFNDNFSGYLSIGMASQRKVGFAKDSKGKFRDPVAKDYTKGIIFNALNTPFVSLGGNIYFGKAKKTYYNFLMYDAFYLNRSFDGSDTNLGSQNIPVEKPQNIEKTVIIKSDIDYRDLKDLIYENE